MAASRKEFARRNSSVAFVKSGWLPALHTFAPLAVSKAGLPSMDRDAKQLGIPKGGARPAHSGQGNVLRAEMWNTAALGSKGATLKSNAMRVAESGLQKGFDAETRSMADYVRKKQMEAEARFNASQKR